MHDLLPTLPGRSRRSSGIARLTCAVAVGAPRATSYITPGPRIGVREPGYSEIRPSRASGNGAAKSDWKVLAPEYRNRSRALTSPDTAVIITEGEIYQFPSWTAGRSVDKQRPVGLARDDHDRSGSPCEDGALGRERIFALAWGRSGPCVVASAPRADPAPVARDARRRDVREPGRVGVVGLTRRPGLA